MKVKIACSGQSVARAIGAKRVRVFNMSTIGVNEIKMVSACILNAHVYQTVQYVRYGLGEHCRFVYPVGAVISHTSD